MSNFYFFDLPVYRVDEERYYKERSEYVDRVIFPLESEYSRNQQNGKTKNTALLDNHRWRLEDAYGGLWRYNEIIGYIRLYFLGQQVRGEYYAVDRQRIVRTRKKQLQFQTWKLAPEVDIDWYATSDEIFATVMKYVGDCRAELSGRFIDEGQLVALGSFIDWRNIFEHSLARHPE